MPGQSPSIWHELATADQTTSGAFFTQLLGWTRKAVDAGPFGTYTLFQKNGLDIAGMMNPTPDTPGKGSFWHFCIGVEDVDECAKRAPLLGGSVLVAPHDVPIDNNARGSCATSRFSFCCREGRNCRMAQ